MVVSDDTKLQAYAYTNGEAIFFCDAFFTMTQSQQIGVYIHELLHVVLAHPFRFMKLRAQKGDKFSSQLANMCADAIVDRAIVATPKLGPFTVELPWKIMAEDIVKPEDLKKIPANQWNLEMLYHYKAPEVEKNQAAVQRWLSQFCKSDDLQPGDKEDPNMSQTEREFLARVWAERFRRAAHGSKPGSILRELMKDLPEPRVPWQKHFRDFMIAHMMPTTTTDWSKPSRRLLASKGKLGHYEPGIQRDIGVKRAGVVIDTSGSIDDALLATFISETNSIMEQTGCEVYLICADAAVKSEQLFIEPIEGKYKCKGGGGTDFRPAIKCLEDKDIDCCVYLTDMCGTFPDKAPPYPIMWATIYDQEPPFGRKVLVDPTTK
jgi:predicted metal-dependent peptidase